MDDLVTTDWLAAHLQGRDLVTLDCSAFLPGSGRDGGAEFKQAHIPGARFLDIESVSDTANPAPHMLPSAERFGEAMESIGVGRDDRIVVYDNSPLRTAARGWFMLRHFGAERVAILDGGLQKWRLEGRPVEQGEARPRTASFDARTIPGRVVGKGQIRSGLGLPLVDARARARFEGAAPEPRAGLASGHIPGARNLPFGEMYNEDGTFKQPQQIRRAFAAAGVDPDHPFVASCGSGVTANSLIFAAHLLGNRDVRLYDGSWSEWGADPALPKATGPA